MNEPLQERVDVVKEPLKKTLLPMHLLFLAMALTFIFLGSLLQHWNFNIGILATEFGMLVLPAVIFMKVKKQSIREQFRFTKPTLMDLVKVIIAGLCFVPLVGFANSLINLWFVYGLNVTPPQIPTETGFFGPIISFLIAAVTPGLCEEFFFRGMLLTEYEKKMGSFQAAFITALLFGLFHYNVMNLLGPILLGLIFAWVMQVTGSIVTAMLGHMVNNTFAVIMLYATANVDQSKNMEAITAVGHFWPFAVLMTIFLMVIISVPLTFVGYLLLKSIRKNHLKESDLLAIGTRKFEVLSATNEHISLMEILEEDGTLNLDTANETIQTTYGKLLKNKGLRILNPHWNFKEAKWPIRFKEWWPVYLSGIIYLVLNYLTIQTMISK